MDRGLPGTFAGSGRFGAIGVVATDTASYEKRPGGISHSEPKPPSLAVALEQLGLLRSNFGQLLARTSGIADRLRGPVPESKRESASTGSCEGAISQLEYQLYELGHVANAISAELTRIESEV